jgi:Pterin 4 alpha carbinolamine dehydratase
VTASGTLTLQKAAYEEPIHGRHGDGDTDADEVRRVPQGRTDRDDAEIDELHRQVSDWDIVELGGITRLRRVFSVDDFAQALEVTSKVGELAEEEGHHPALLTE